MDRSGEASSTGSVATDGDSPGGGAQDVVDKAQQMAGQVADRAQEKTSQVAEQVKQQASSRLSTQIDRAAEGAESVSQAFRAVGGQLRKQDQAMLAEYADKAAEQVQRAASYLRGKNLDQLVDETEHFARRQPAVFVAGAFALGLVAARFLKSSGQRAGPKEAQPALPAPAVDPGSSA